MKKHKTIYWKKDTSAAEETTNEGVFKKKKKNNKQNKKNENIIENKLVDEKKNRGLLFDRNGRILASNIYIYNFFFFIK